MEPFRVQAVWNPHLVCLVVVEFSYFSVVDAWRYVGSLQSLIFTISNIPKFLNAAVFFSYQCRDVFAELIIEQTVTMISKFLITSSWGLRSCNYYLNCKFSICWIFLPKVSSPRSYKANTSFKQLWTFNIINSFTSQLVASYISSMSSPMVVISLAV